MDDEAMEQEFKYTSVVNDPMSPLGIPSGSIFVMGATVNTVRTVVSLIYSIRGKMIFTVWRIVFY